MNDQALRLKLQSEADRIVTWMLTTPAIADILDPPSPARHERRHRQAASSTEQPS